MTAEDEDEDRAGMEEALERAREEGGRDVFGVLDEPAETPPPELPQTPQGVEAVAPPPPAPAEELPDPKAALAKAISAPQPDAYAKAQERADAISARRYQPSQGLSDEAIAKAKAERKAAIGRNDFTRAIQAALLRRPFNPTDPEDEAGGLLAQRAREESQFELNRRSDMELQTALAKALRGEKVPQGNKYEDPYHAALGDQARSLVEERKRKALEEEEKKKRVATEVEALRREAGKQLPGVDVSGLGAEDLRSLIRAKDAKQRAQILAAAKKAAADEGRPLAPTALEGLADADVAKKQVASLAGKFKELGMGTPSAKASAFFTKLLGFQFTDAAQFEAEAGRVRQAAGKILEGGKLAAGDETKYQRLMLQPGDSDEVVALKTSGMIDFLEDIKAGRIKVYRAGGYKVPESLDTPPPAESDPIVTLVAKDGRTKRVRRSAAQEFIDSHPGQATIR